MLSCAYQLRKNGSTNKKFSISPGVNLVTNNNDCSFFESMVFAPQQSIKLLVTDENLVMKDTSYIVSIKYETLNKSKAYEDKYSLIQQYTKYSGYTETRRHNTSKSESALIDISHSLDTIKTTLL